MELGMHGCVALVTGAAGGIGRAVGHALAAEGVKVALADRDAAGVAAAVAAIIACGGEASGVVVDVTDETQVDAAVTEIVKRLDGIDLLVSCAGISGPMGTSLGDTMLADWERVFAVNVTGGFLVLRAALPWLRRSAAASVVFIASDSALVAADGMAPYCASKAAVVQFARAAAVELAPEGIRVNALCPSIVDTPLSRTDLALPSFDGVSYPVQSAAEVAYQVAVLCSPRSRPMNAAVVVSDFGYSARSGFPA